MKISRKWLQGFFEKPLPEATALADALTFHAFEIESVERVGEDDVLDVKVTPNRGHDCLCHRGIAKEISAILELPLDAKKDPLATTPDLSKHTSAVSVAIDSSADGRCARYIAGHIRGVKVGPSPEWLQRSLEAIGQRSINNIVDATNLVMFNTGQPLHAFDAGKLSMRDAQYAICVRFAKQGETMFALDDKAYALSSGDLVIVDAHTDTVIGVAGVKGGKPTGVDERTADILIEAANFDGVSVRKTAQALKLRTDASDRFQQVISPELAAYGMQQAVQLIVALAGGEVLGFVDVYPVPQEARAITVQVAKVNAILGTQLEETDVANVFQRLGFSYKNSEVGPHCFEVEVPFERLDLTPPIGGPEDLIEEVGRIVGYEQVPSEELPIPAVPVAINPSFYAAEKTREELMAAGYSEVYTSVFADTGERSVANKAGGERPYLRTTLLTALREAHERNMHHADLLGVRGVRIFEIGAVWKDGKEITMIGTVDETGGAKERPLVPLNSASYDTLPVSEAERYAPFSRYPSITRDIAMWVPAATSAETVSETIRAHAGKLLARADLFDEFKKGERTSYAFRIVFQSFEKTLTDAEVNGLMIEVSAALTARGYEIR